MPASESLAGSRLLMAELGVPRFHFNVYDGFSDPDREGMDLPDWEAARAEAIRQSGLILADNQKRFVLGEVWRMEVTDESGMVLFRLDFTVSEGPAMMYEARGKPKPPT